MRKRLVLRLWRETRGSSKEKTSVTGHQLSGGTFWNQGPHSASYSYSLRFGCAFCIRCGMRQQRVCVSPWMRRTWYVVFCDKVKTQGLCHLKGSRGDQCELREGTRMGGWGEEGYYWGSHSLGTLLTWDLAESTPSTAAWSLGFSSWRGSGLWDAGLVDGADKSPEETQ